MGVKPKKKKKRRLSVLVGQAEFMVCLTDPIGSRDEEE